MAQVGARLATLGVLLVGCGGGPSAELVRDCAAHDQAACVADSRCVADQCLDCNGRPQFAACIAAGAEPGDCAAPVCSCHQLASAAACSAAGRCRVAFCVDMDIQRFAGCFEPSDTLPTCPPRYGDGRP